MSKRSSRLSRLKRRFQARFAQPQRVFLGADGLPALAVWCQSHEGAAAQVVVSAQICHELVCDPDLPLQDDPSILDYARQLFGHYFGAGAQRWSMAGWRAGERCGVTALHGIDWAAMKQLVYEHEVDLRGVVPAWSLVLRGLAHREQPWFSAPTSALAWVEAQVLTWLLLRHGQVLAIRQMRLVTPTHQALGEILEELRQEVPAVQILVLGYGLDAQSLSEEAALRVLAPLNQPTPDLAWFDSTTRGIAGLPQPDFMGTPIVRSKLAWPFLVTCALVLAVATTTLIESNQQLRWTQERWDQLRTSQRMVTTPIAANVKLLAGGAEQERLRGASEVRALLQQPWEPLLTTVEQAGEGLPVGQLAWLGMDYDGARNELRLEGLAPDKAMALQVVDRLSEAPGWREVVLSRFQKTETGQAGQRFELSAKLHPAMLRVGSLSAAKEVTP